LHRDLGVRRDRRLGERRVAPGNLQGAGELFVRLYELQEATFGEIGFNATARVERKRVLIQRDGTTFRAHRCTHARRESLDDRWASSPR
jgi:hypothetical protein